MNLVRQFIAWLLSHIRGHSLRRQGVFVAALVAAVAMVALGSVVLPGGMVNEGLVRLEGSVAAEQSQVKQATGSQDGETPALNEASTTGDASSDEGSGSENETPASEETPGTTEEPNESSNVDDSGYDVSQAEQPQSDFTGSVDASAQEGKLDAAQDSEAAASGRTLSAETDAYKVSLTYDGDAGIPNGASLRVTELAEGSDDYAAARDAVVDAKTAEDEDFDEENLGLAAVDISILDASGAEIEPTGDVRVTIEARALPDEATGGVLDVRHIVEAGDSEGDAADGPVAKTMDAEVTIEDGTARAEFGTDSFSVYVITWTRDSSSAQRVGYVRLHTVNDSGSDITDVDTYTTSELTKISGESGILTIADWVKTKNPDGYTYTEARLGSSSGTVITGLKVAEARSTSGGTTTTSYTLQYTSDATVGSSSTWNDVTDANSGDEVNNADVYLVFAKNASFTSPVYLHFMTLSGVAIEDKSGNPIVNSIDAAEHTDEYDLAATYAMHNAPDGYAFDTANMNTATSGTCKIILQQDGGLAGLGSIRGSYYRYLKYEDGTVKLARGDKVWHEVPVGEVHIYISFKPSLTLTFHHVDSEGTTVAGDTTRTLTSATTIALSGGADVVSGYAAASVGYLGAAAADGGTAFSSVTFSNDSGGWTLSYTSGSTTRTADAVSEVWFVYDKMSDNVPIVIHYVDQDGVQIADSSESSITVSSSNSAFRDQWNGYQVNSTNFAELTIDGYTYVGDYLGATLDDQHRIPSGYRVQYRYDTSTSTWQSGVGATATDTSSSTHRAFDGYLTDIYRVYQKNDTSAHTFTVHYVNERKNPISGQADETFTLDSSSGTSEQELSSGSLVRDIDGMAFVGSYLGSEDDSLTQNQGYVTTDYPNVMCVRVQSDGTTSFLMAVTSGEVTLNMTRSNRWSYTTTRGRTFTLRREATGSGDNQSVRFSLVDDQVSTTATDLNLTGVSGSTETYAGTFVGDNTSVTYTVRATTDDSSARSVTTYTLEVSEWMQNDLTDIYQVYGSTSALTNPSIEVKNDLVYTGHLVVQTDPVLQQALDNAGREGTTGADVSNVSYTWYKILNQPNVSEGTEVTRVLNEGSWNIAQDPAKRTWLDLAADDGALGEGKTSVRYYCVLSYTYGGHTYSVRSSNTLSMINYDELENGGFETPQISSWHAQLSNSMYYSEGIWRTTGTNGGQDIEIVNTVNDNGAGKGPYSWNTQQTFEAHGGEQFAELNCEAAGALYQDVVTHPYENLSYWLSHRARGQNPDSTPEYDTMYLVIMPTKLAMTSAADGGELKKQEDLEAFIRERGGFATSLATSDEAVVTYRDAESGVLIERISSSDQAWHTVSVANGYTAMAGLTRFFFVAGPTSAGSNTVGNFLDDVGFSQDLPDPTSKQFQVVVTKTFSNLQLSDIAKLADNATDNPFTLTIRAYDDETTAEGRLDAGNERDGSNGDLALDHARLTFSVSGDDVTLHATDGDSNGTNLFARGDGSNGTVTVNDDAGTVTMTWTLLGNEAANVVKYYTVDETGQDVGGFTCNTSQTGTVSGTPVADTHVATVGGGQVLRANFTNSYNQNSQITVQKVFSGITPTTVRELAGNAENPYTVTLTRSSDNASLALVYDEQKPYSNETLPTDVQNVTFSVRQGTGGISILTWTVTGWDAGTYEVRETGYHPQGEASSYNTLAETTINGIAVGELPEGGTAAEVSVARNVTVGSGSEVPTVNATGSSTIGVPADGTATLTDAETNLLVVQYVQHGTSSNATGYLVWTPQSAGVNVRQAIVNHIREKFNDDTVTLAQVSFYSSENPGVMQVNDASVSYDADTRTLTFTKSPNTEWLYYYGTTYTLERTKAGSTTETEVVASDEPEIRIRNNYNPILKIEKIEEGHTDRHLEGATFRLYRTTESGREYYLSTSETSTARFGSGTTSAKTFTTSDVGTVTVGVLPMGTYYLEETSAPNGYMAAPDVGFYVGSEGVVSLLGDDDSRVSRTEHAEVTLTDPYYTITVSDELGAELPSTGGPGGIAMSLLYLVGLVATTLLSGWLAFRWSASRAE